MTQNTSPICAKTTWGQKNTRVSLKTWGGQSPDWTPIELVWDELDRRVKAKQPTVATNPWELLPRTWDELSEERLISIVERMPRVRSAVNICQSWLLLWAKSLEYILIYKLIPWFLWCSKTCETKGVIENREGLCDSSLNQIFYYFCKHTRIRCLFILWKPNW